jgi:nucleotide sugar dehydrogenase
MTVTVIGAGKMGLPLIAQFASKGAGVWACDANPAVVNAINQGVCPIDEPGISELLAEAVASGKIRATGDTTAAVRESEVIVVIVPVLLTAGQDADLSIIEAVSRQIAAGLRPGTMVSYETTLPVGSTRRLAAILEGSGLKAGSDFDLVFSPERVKSQLVIQRLTENPKVVGGITPGAAERAARFYSEYLGAPVINVGTLEAAELVKLAGMLYRDVNIALANELARYAEASGINLYPVIEAANTDGEAFLLRPGIGVGGHCTPVYPYFLIRDSQRRGLSMDLASKSRAINDQQPVLALDRVEQLWRPLRGSRAMILGLGFRPQVKEQIFSPAFLLRDELLRRGAAVFLNDPLYTDDEIRFHSFSPVKLDAPVLPEVLILNTAHMAYQDLDFGALSLRGVQVVVDGRAFWQPETVSQAGVLYLGVGRPATRAVLAEVAVD